MEYIKYFTMKDTVGRNICFGERGHDDFRVAHHIFSLCPINKFGDYTLPWATEDKYF